MPIPTENKPQKQSEEEKKGEQKYPHFDPKVLLGTKAPLDEAIKFLNPLQFLSTGKIEPHLLAFAIHSRRGISEITPVHKLDFCMVICDCCSFIFQVKFC